MFEKWSFNDFARLAGFPDLQQMGMEKTFRKGGSFCSFVNRGQFNVVTFLWGHKKELLMRLCLSISLQKRNLTDTVAQNILKPWQWLWSQNIFKEPPLWYILPPLQQRNIGLLLGRRCYDVNVNRLTCGFLNVDVICRVGRGRKPWSAVWLQTRVGGARSLGWQPT